MLTLAAAGNQGAFLVLYDRYKMGVTLHVSKLISIREEVEDVVVESFQKAFSQLSMFNPDYRFSTWLFRIARNTALDHIEKYGRSASNMPMNSIDDESTSLGDIASQTGNPEVDVIRGQEYDKLVCAIGDLPELYRDIARMALLENYGYQEIAEKTGLPLGTVKTRIRRAKENILKVMEDSSDD